MQKNKFILILSLFLTFFALSATAQVRDSDITLQISPEFPGPNQSVNASVGSFVTNLDKANISWSLNGEEKLVGIGKKNFSFETDNSNLPVILSVTIDTLGGQSVSKTLTISPASVDLLWQADDSYTPPFYKGRSLVASQGKFKVVAMPNLAGPNGNITPENFSYSWTKDDSVQTNSSGWGKNYLILQNSYLDKGNFVSVKVSDITGNTSGSGKINLQTVNPKIIFYENKPEIGTIWENALGDNLKINQNGGTIVAEPYFFSPKNINSPDLSVNWYINGDKVGSPDYKNILSVKPESGQSGNATIKIDISNINTLFQELTKELNVSF